MRFKTNLISFCHLLYLHMIKLFNRISHNFSKTFDLAVIGGGPGGKDFPIKDMLQLLRRLNSEWILFVSKREDRWEVLVSTSAAFRPRLCSISLTNIMSSIMILKHLVSMQLESAMIGTRFSVIRLILSLRSLKVSKVFSKRIKSHIWKELGRLLMRKICSSFIMKWSHRCWGKRNYHS